MSVFLLLILLYMYFVGNTIIQVVMRQEITKEIADLNSDISTLETQFILAQNAINKDLATAKGFVSNGNSKIFIDRSPGTLVLSTGN